MASVNIPQKKSNASALQAIGAVAGGVATGTPAGASQGAGYGSQMSGMLGGNKVVEPIKQQQVQAPQPDQGPDPAMQRRLQELEQARLAAMNQKLYG